MGVVGDIISGVGGLITGGTNYEANRETNAANRDIANSTNEMNRSISREQMGFQDYESSTAYQRSMADMRAAGLNPILAAKNGGASTPSGAGIPAVTGAPTVNPMQGVSDSVMNAVNTAVGFQRNMAEIDNIKTQNDKIRADTDLSKAQTINTAQSTNTGLTTADLNKALAAASRTSLPYNTSNTASQTRKNEASAALEHAHTDKTYTENLLRRAEIPAASNKASVESGRFGQILAYLDRFNHTISSAGDAARSFLPKVQVNQQNSRSYTNNVHRYGEQ